MFLFPSTVLQLTELTSDTFSIRLSCPKSFISRFNPGQFVMVSVTGASRFDPLLKRPFSICRLKPDGFELLIKVVGRGTDILRQITVGAVLPVHGPLGNGFPVENISNDKKVMLVAGGIGIAPIISLLDYLLQSSHPLPAIDLIVGAGTAGELLGIEEFEKQAGGHGLKLSIATDDGSMGYRGMVTDLVSRQLQLGGEKPIIFSCGPSPMLTALGKLAMKASCSCYLSLENHMACGFGVCLGCVTRKKMNDEQHPWLKVCHDGPVFNALDLQL